MINSEYAKPCEVCGNPSAVFDSEYTGLCEKHMDKRSKTSAINGKLGGRPRELLNFKALPDENWRPVKGFPSYFVSDLGRVLSIKRSKPKILKPKRTYKKYLRGTFYKGNKPIEKYIHRIVLVAFKGEAPPGTQASHLNGIRDDNRSVNLIWETPKQNCQRKRNHGTFYEGDNHHSSKLNSKDVEAIRRSYKRWKVTLKSLGLKYRVNEKTIGDIVRRISWKHI